MMSNSKCILCPRKCGANRTKHAGLCGGRNNLKIARAALHFWEEPCISGENGSGTIFFSGCHLQCVFCQNSEISSENFGKEISVERLSEIFFELEQAGAHNINLVSPTHFVPQIIQALQLERPSIPVVYNSCGYESIETLKLLEGYIDIYLPDIKYKSSELSAKYSGAPDYFRVASAAVKEMFRQTGTPEFDGDILKRGTILRHMVLPNCYKDSIDIINWLSDNFAPDEILVSLMSQYTPAYRSEEFPEINRRVTTFEYKKALSALFETDFTGYTQERGSANKGYTPPFDLSGV